ncbi:MFS transporter [Pseudomonadales bacterium]|nr:MFS transporter [Pseudomonadota bacterium]MDA8627959.1 MFS transporter [Pseudomonadales bacterium]MDC3357262.1 MFS transporter [Pseudomonadales bacterium]
MNRVALTLASFLAYFALSGMLAPIGILVQPSAAALGVSAGEMVRTLGFFSTGTLAGSLAAVVLLPSVKLRTLTLSVYGVACCVLLCLLLMPTDLRAIAAMLCVLGACLGIGLAQAALVISRIYSETYRPSMLVATDGSFSLAGFVTASATVFLLTQGAPWASIYGLILAVVLVIFVAAFWLEFPENVRSEDPEDAGLSVRAWPRTIWFLAAALFCYTFGQSSFLIWLPSFAQTSIGLSAAESGHLVGQYWLGMFIGQILTVVIVVRLGAVKMSLTGALGCFMAAALLFTYPLSLDSPSMLALIWGICNFGLLKCLISQATLAFNETPAGLIPSLLLAASLGTACSPLASSWMVEALGVAAGMMTGLVSLAAVLLLVVAAIAWRRDMNLSGIKQ